MSSDTHKRTGHMNLHLNCVLSVCVFLSLSLCFSFYVSLSPFVSWSLFLSASGSLSVSLCLFLSFSLSLPLSLYQCLTYFKDTHTSLSRYPCSKKLIFSTEAVEIWDLPTTKSGAWRATLWSQSTSAERTNQQAFPPLHITPYTETKLSCSYIPNPRNNKMITVCCQRCRIWESLVHISM